MKNVTGKLTIIEAKNVIDENITIEMQASVTTKRKVTEGTVIIRGQS